MSELQKEDLAFYRALAHFLKCTKGSKGVMKKKVYGRPKEDEQQHDARKKSGSTHGNSASATTASGTSPH